MVAVLKKEVGNFFSSIVGYLVVFVFLGILGTMMWVLPDFSVFEYPYASLDGLFNVAPVVFLFLIPAITMRSFAEEFSQGTMEFLSTRPIKPIAIVLGKYLGCLFVVIIALLPTILYVLSIWNLGSPVGNIDVGQVAGSYLGMFFLATVYTAIGLLCSAISKNSIAAFLLTVTSCLLLHYGLFFISRLSIFAGTFDLTIQKMGVDYHYKSISRGVLEVRDLIYFISVSAFFLILTDLTLKLRRD